MYIKIIIIISFIFLTIFWYYFNYEKIFRAFPSAEMRGEWTEGKTKKFWEEKGKLDSLENINFRKV